MTPGRPCTGRTDLFFSVDDDQLAQAAALCQGCPARQDCYLEGIKYHDRHAPSVWGAVIFPEEYRQLMRLKRQAAS